MRAQRRGKESSVESLEHDVRFPSYDGGQTFGPVDLQQASRAGEDEDDEHELTELDPHYRSHETRTGLGSRLSETSRAVFVCSCAPAPA